MREFIIGPYYKPEDFGNLNMYKICYKKAREQALQRGRELAEGPTVLYLDSYYGPVELWPLVYVEEVTHAVQRKTISSFS